MIAVVDPSEEVIPKSTWEVPSILVIQLMDVLDAVEVAVIEENWNVGRP